MSPSRHRSTASAMSLAVVGILSGFGAPLCASEKVVVGAGCFWCVEAIYEQLPGVIAVVSGYAGGVEPDPNYRSVSAGRTGHAEVVEIEFDPETTSLRDLVDFFWKTHDPTDPRGVWPDFGPHYRSILLYDGDHQKMVFEQSKTAAQSRMDKPIATGIAPLARFYPAEEYHQDYVRKNPGDRYVVNVAYKKLEKLGLDIP